MREMTKWGNWAADEAQTVCVINTNTADSKKNPKKKRDKVVQMARKTKKSEKSLAAFIKKTNRSEWVCTPRVVARGYDEA